jgi:hypothetical protein
MVLEYAHGCTQTYVHHVQNKWNEIKDKHSSIMINKIRS